MTRVSSGSSPYAASRTRRSIDHRKADSVLPEPVGAQISVSDPDAIAGQPSRWGGVGSPKVRRNHSRTGALKRSSIRGPL